MEMKAVNDMADNVMKNKEVSLLSHLVYAVFFSVLMIISVILQCSEITFFGVIPDITFTLVCAIGFIAGEKYGGIFGLSAGVLIMMLGGSGISLSPIMYTLCGYLCGALPNLILRRNFLSYIVYTAMMGAIHILFSLIYLIMLSESFQIWKTMGKQVVPEFLSCVIFMVMAYGMIFVIYGLFRGKKKKSRS